MYQVMHAKILPRELRVKTLPWHRCYIVCLVLNSRASGSCTSATGDKKPLQPLSKPFRNSTHGWSILLSPQVVVLDAGRVAEEAGVTRQRMICSRL